MPFIQCGPCLDLKNLLARKIVVVKHMKIKTARCSSAIFPFLKSQDSSHQINRWVKLSSDVSRGKCSKLQWPTIVPRGLSQNRMSTKRVSKSLDYRKSQDAELGLAWLYDGQQQVRWIPTTGSKNVIQCTGNITLLPVQVNNSVTQNTLFLS